MKIIIAAYGLAGQTIINSLITKHQVSRNDIWCFTYSTSDNCDLINFLKQHDIRTNTECISNVSHEELLSFSPDIIGSVYYRDIIPERIRNIAK